METNGNYKVIIWQWQKKLYNVFFYSATVVYFYFWYIFRQTKSLVYFYSWTMLILKVVLIFSLHFVETAWTEYLWESFEMIFNRKCSVGGEKTFLSHDFFIQGRRRKGSRKVLSCTVIMFMGEKQWRSSNFKWHCQNKSSLLICISKRTLILSRVSIYNSRRLHSLASTMQTFLRIFFSAGATKKQVVYMFGF